MQDVPTLLPDWTLKAALWLASFVGLRGIEKLITVWLNRKKPALEAQKTEAEATEIRIRSYSTAADSNLRMMERLQDTLDDIDRIRAERDELKMRVDLQLMDMQWRDEEVKQLKGILDAKGIKIPEIQRKPKS